MKHSAAFTKEAWFESEMQTVLELKLKGLDRKEILDRIVHHRGDGSFVSSRKPLIYQHLREAEVI